MTINEIKADVSFATDSISAVVQSSTKNVIILPPPRSASMLEIEDTHFHLNSAVLLPGYAENASSGTESGQAKGLGVLVAATIQVTQSDQSILVVGHTDRSGSDTYNQSLSELRASNVYYALRGDRERWVASTLKKAKTEDYQCILAWLTNEEGWKCDPGEIDDIEDAEAHMALRNFQDEYNTRFKPSIDSDGVIGPQTWGAIFNVYMEWVAITLGVDAAELHDMQESMTFLTAPTLGCGERCPITPDTEGNYRNPVDRRVEILFFDPKEEPPAEARDLCSILYLKGLYTFTPVPLDPSGTVDTMTIIDEIEEPVSKASVEVTLTDGSKRTTRTSIKGKVRVFGKKIAEVTVEDVHDIFDV